MNLEINQALIEKLIRISYQAGEAILKIYGEKDQGITHKTDNSPLTRADKASNKIMCDGLRQISSGLPIISEENEIPDYAERKENDLYWLLDPLDGTKEFIKKNGDFTTNIALIKDGKPIVGIVFVPVLDDLYWGATGLGAYKVNQGKAKPISVRSFDPNSKDVVITCSRSHLNEDTKAYISNYDNPTLYKVGSSLKLMMVSEGKADIYPRLGPISEWDIAASHIILEQAGGRLYKHEDGQPVKYNKENLLMPNFIAEGKRI